jgi:rhodanese-related sulfurtransferase
MLKLTRLQWLTGLLGTLAFAQDKKVKQYTADELKDLLANEKNLFFLDVREPQEVEQLGSIKGYVNIPLSQVESRLSEIPRNKVIVTA